MAGTVWSEKVETTFGASTALGGPDSNIGKLFQAMPYDPNNPEMVRSGDKFQSAVTGSFGLPNQTFIDALERGLGDDPKRGIKGAETRAKILRLAKDHPEMANAVMDEVIAHPERSAQIADTYTARAAELDQQALGAGAMHAKVEQTRQPAQARGSEHADADGGHTALSDGGTPARTARAATAAAATAAASRGASSGATPPIIGTPGIPGVSDAPGVQTGIGILSSLIGAGANIISTTVSTGAAAVDSILSTPADMARTGITPPFFDPDNAPILNRAPAGVTPPTFLSQEGVTQALDDFFSVMAPANNAPNGAPRRGNHAQLRTESRFTDHGAPAATETGVTLAVNIESKAGKTAKLQAPQMGV